MGKTSDPAVKEALKRETDQAIAKGVFGVPTFIVDDELFWGNDQIEFVELYLDGKDPLDRQWVSEVLSRPRTADRPGKQPIR